MNTDDLAAVIRWLDLYQATRPAELDLDDPASAALNAAQATRDAGTTLPLESEPSGFTSTLETLARSGAAET